MPSTSNPPDLSGFALLSQLPPTSFVTNDMMTVAQLHANYPPSASNAGLYGRVSDLWGSVDDVMRCRFDGANYRWVPQRDSFVGTSAAASGTVNILPLVTPPTLRLTGTLLGNMSVAPSSTNAYIGQRQTVVMNGVLGLFAATITNLIGSNITLLGGGSRDLQYGPTGWFAAT